MLSSRASCMIVSGLRAGLDLDTYPLSDLIHPWCAERAKPRRGKPVLTMHIGFFASFSRHISRTQSFQQNRHINFLALVALKLLVSLISRPVACSPRIVVDTQTHTHRPSTVTLAAHACRGLIIKCSRALSRTRNEFVCNNPRGCSPRRYYMILNAFSEDSLACPCN